MLDDEFSDSLMENMKSIANVVRIGTQDKFSQVYYASLNLLQGMLNKLKIVKFSDVIEYLYNTTDGKDTIFIDLSCGYVKSKRVTDRAARLFARSEEKFGGHS